MTTNAELKNRRLAAAPRGVGVMCDFHAAQADNALITDVEGQVMQPIRMVVTPDGCQLSVSRPLVPLRSVVSRPDPGWSETSRPGDRPASTGRPIRQRSERQAGH